MRIENIHVDGFGVWTDKNWGPLGPRLNAFYGPNETGKSTLMAFIRSMLFGFEKRGNPKRYDPVNGGSHGGWLDLVVGDTHLRLVRNRDAMYAGPLLYMRETKPVMKALWNDCLGAPLRRCITMCLPLVSTNSNGFIRWKIARSPRTFPEPDSALALPDGLRFKRILKRVKAPCFSPAARTARSMLLSRSLNPCVTTWSVPSISRRIT